MTRRRLAIVSVVALIGGAALLFSLWPRRPAERPAATPPESAEVIDTSAPRAPEPGDSRLDASSNATPIGDPVSKPKGSTVVGRVLRFENGERAPLAGVGVEIVAWEVRPAVRIRPIRRTASTSDGTFRFEGVDVDFQYDSTLTMRVRDRYWSGSGSILSQATRTADGVDVGDLLAFSSGTVSGRCVSPDGRPVAGVEVVACPFVDPNAPPEHAWDVNGEDTFQARAASDAEGRFLIGAILPGPRFEVRAIRGTFAPARSEPFVTRAECDVSVGDLVLPIGGEIAAHVRDARGRPIAGASLLANRKLVDANKPEILPGPAIETSGDDGTVHMAHLSPAHYFLIASAEKLAPATIEDVVVEEGATPTPLEIVLTAGAFIAGRVTDAGGTPISGATLRAHAQGAVDGALDRSSTTDAQGRYRIEALGNARIQLSARADGWVSQSKSPVDVDHDDVDFVLTAKGCARGRVVRPDGAPAASATVRVVTKDVKPWAAASVRSDVQGTFVASLKAGAYTLVAQHDDFADSEPVDVIIEERASAADVTLALRAGATIRGLVLAAADRASIGAALVAAMGAGTQTPIRPVLADEPTKKSAVTSPDGSFTLRGVSPGTVEIRAEAVSWLDATSAPIEVAEGAILDGVIVLLHRGATVCGTVYGDDDQPSAGVPVNLYEGSRPVRETKTRDVGTYSIDRIPPGYYHIMRMPKDPFGGSGSFESVPLTLREGDDLVVDLGAKSDSGGAGCRVFGSVLAGGQPLVAQVVMVKTGAGGFHAAQEKSNEAGHYEFAGVTPGRYRVLVQPEGDVGNFSLTIEVPERREWRVDLPAPEGVISGRVVDADTGEALAGIAVLALRADASANVNVETFVDVLSGKVDTQSDGEYRLRHVAPGPYRIQAGAFAMDGPVEGRVDYAVETVEVTVGVDGPVTADFRLRRGATLEGSVRDASGAPVSAAVRVDEDPIHPTFNSLVGVSTSDRGGYVVRGLHSGEHAVSVTSRTHAPQRRRVRVGDHSTTADFVVVTGGALQVAIVTERGEPVRGAILEIRDANGDVVPTGTGALDLLVGGSPAASPLESSFPHLAAGTYAVRASKSGVGSGSATVLVEGGSSVSVRIVVK